MSAEAVTYELRDNVAWLGLNRPRKRNAILVICLAAPRKDLGKSAIHSGPWALAPPPPGCVSPKSSVHWSLEYCSVISVLPPYAYS
jgi:hypothetical protein